MIDVRIVNGPSVLRMSKAILVLSTAEFIRAWRSGTQTPEILSWGRRVR
jgi:hypothetical protein